MAKIFISLLVIASLAGVVTDASTTAVPGDTLYPFKVHVTEQMGRLLAFTHYEKADISADIAEDRLKEMQTLINNHVLTSTVEVQLVTSFDIETNNILNQIQALVAKGDAADAHVLLENFQTTVATSIANLPADSGITSHLQATLSSLSAFGGTISTSTSK